MPPKPQSPNDEKSTGKELLNKDGSVTKLVELATANVDNVDDLINLFGASGVEYSVGEEVTGDYRLVPGDEKQRFLQRVQGCRVGVVKWNFIQNSGQREFVALHVIVDGHGKFILNDSSRSGIYDQLSRITSKRIDEGWPQDRAHAGVVADGGFVQNKEFYYRSACPDHGTDKEKGCEFCERVGKAIPKSEFDSVPSSEKEKARPTWRLDFGR